MNNLVNKSIIKKSLKENYKNFNNLYTINLKVSIKTASILAIGIIMSVVLFIFLAVELSTSYSPEASYSSMRDLTYIFCSGIAILTMMVLSFYLYKTQTKNGIQAIELRAGYTIFKSFLIRQFIQITIFSIYIIPVFVLSLSFIFLFNISVSFYIGTIFSQIFFVLIIGLLAGIIVNTLILGFKTAMAACLSTIFLILVSLVPFIYNISSSTFSNMNGSSNNLNLSTINLKFKTGSDFYQEFKDDSNVKNIFKDDINSLYNLNNNYNSMLDEFVNVGGNRSKEPYVTNSLSKWLIDYKVKSFNPLNKPFFEGELMYNYKLVKYEKPVLYIFQNMSFFELLKAINDKLLSDDIFNSLNKSYQNVVPYIFNNNKYNKTINVRLESLLNDVKTYLPDYSNLAEYINQVYLENYDFMSNRENNIINTVVSSSYNSLYENDTWGYRFFCDSNYNVNSKPNCDKDVVDRNDKLAEKYKLYPELKVFNAVFLGLWKNSMLFSMSDEESVSSSLDSYLYASQKYSSIRTQIILHWPMLFSGLFMDPLIDDSYSTLSSISMSKPSTYIKNLFNYEYLSPEYLPENSGLTPIFEKEKLEYSLYFNKGLAIFVYIVLVSPLLYIDWLLFKRKARI
ncbi:hypothetical protein SCORR_v1c00950 [Spiroplasma corruscae]|uniref:Uncharacterized protein n=1 Tax=Spiroplasma corruscae TaxID=216934 RepID=A0A222EMY1_9MOLU|nr:hypothetical protein [Spiroplasma corruscae]ASP27870.1 hypothetical protein SCORR_v1c00950 [Spiroplasma corruscae]